MASKIQAALVLFILAAAFIGPVRAEEATATVEDGVQKVELRAGGYYFRPDHVVVVAGVPVEITIINEDWITPHNFVISSEAGGLDIRESIGLSSAVVRLSPRLPGTYRFYCDKKLPFFPSHREKGMEGTLEVVEAGKSGGGENR